MLNVFLIDPIISLRVNAIVAKQKEKYQNSPAFEFKDDCIEVDEDVDNSN